MLAQNDFSYWQIASMAMNAKDIVGVNEGSAEERFYERRVTKLPGKITYGEYSFALDCTIRDLSVIGALVSVSHPKKLPEKLVLIEPSNLLAFEASVVRRGINLVGLSFKRVIFLDRELDDGERVLLMHAMTARSQWGNKSSAAM